MGQGLETVAIILSTYHLSRGPEHWVDGSAFEYHYVQNIFSSPKLSDQPLGIGILSRGYSSRV